MRIFFDDPEMKFENLPENAAPLPDILKFAQTLSSFSKRLGAFFPR